MGPLSLSNGAALSARGGPAAHASARSVASHALLVGRPTVRFWIVGVGRDASLSLARRVLAKRLEVEGPASRISPLDSRCAIRVL